MARSHCYEAVALHEGEEAAQENRSRLAHTTRRIGLSALALIFVAIVWFVQASHLADRHIPSQAATWFSSGSFVTPVKEVRADMS